MFKRKRIFKLALNYIIMYITHFMALKEEIKKIFKGDVDDSAETLEKYSRDASLFKVRPRIVVFPKDTDDVKNLVAYAASARSAGEDISLTARSAGTDMSGGALTESVIVEFTKYFNRLKELGSNYAVVEPGMFYRDFEAETLKKNLLLPSYPASRELCAVGGMVANNSGGEKTLNYGKTENYIEELKMVLKDGNEYAFKKLTFGELEEKKAMNTLEGEIYRKVYDLVSRNYDLLKKAKPKVTKNSSGYYLWNVLDWDKKTFDLTRLIAGSQGTFGLITEIKFRLIRPEPASRLLIIFLKDLKPLATLTETILKYKPESFESYDDNTFKLAIKFFPEILHRVKGSFLRIVLGLLPEAWLLLSGGMPKLVLLAEFIAATAEEASQKAEAARAELKKKFNFKMRVTKSDEEGKTFWVIRRESFNLLRQHVRGFRTAPFIDDLSVPAYALPEFLPKLYAILNQYKLIYTIAGHVGDGNFHIIPLMNLKDPQAKNIISELSKKVYDLTLAFGGSITAEHNDGIIRTPFLKQAYGEEVYKLFEETKKIFDPEGIFNPGKKVGGTLDYALSHLDIEE